jgi:hypothetical protein
MSTRTHINGHRILFRVTTREHAEGKAPACPFIVICEDEGSDTCPPALITACWDGVSDAWEGSDYSTPRTDITGLVEAAKRRAGWGGGER